MPRQIPFKPNWGQHPNRMAAALYFNRKRKRVGGSSAPSLGPELVTDGTFTEACGINWTCGTGWTIGPPTAHSNGAVGNTAQALAVVQGKTYIVKFDTLNGTYNGLGLRVALAGQSGDAIARVAADGSHEVELVAGSGVEELYFENTVQDQFIGEVTNVSVREKL